jgi:hypothetical protein
MSMLAPRLTGLVVVLAVVACGGDRDPTSGSTSSNDVATFARLQSSVLTPSCAVSGCHVSASAAASGNLVLSPDVAYDNLVGARATSLSAQRDGMKRVVPFHPDSSLLFQKIVLALVSRTADYGNTMPVGTAPLSQGQVDFIRKWIEAGAPKTGDVVDATLLANKTPQSASAFLPLSPPPPGQGIQIHVDSFGVHSNFERELFVYRSLGNATEIYVNRIQTLMRTLSHHFVLYSIDPTMAPGLPCTPAANTVRDIRNADGSMNYVNMIPMACHVFIGGAMTQASDYVFPPGVALSLPASMSIDMNVHYVNRTTAEVPGEAYANLYTVPFAQVQKVAHTLNMSNTSFSLPPGKETTVSKTFTVSQTTTVFMLTSHMHMLGTRFQIRVVGGARDGELVYENTDWAHPQTLTLATPIVLEKGQGLRSTITWNNTTDHVVSFGLQSTDEMGIIFGYYF